MMVKMMESPAFYLEKTVTKEKEITHLSIIFWIASLSFLDV